MTAEEIAAGLTEAQREAMLALYQDPARHAPYHVFWRSKGNCKAWRELAEIGFVTNEGDGFDLVITPRRPTAMVSLTPLGMQVRAILESNHDRA